MGTSEAYQAFEYAVDKEAEVRRDVASLQGREAVGFPATGEVELSDPNRLGATWRGVFATILLAAAILVALSRFFRVWPTIAIPPSDNVFFVAFIGLLVAFLLVVIGWGSVKVKWSPKSGDGEDEEEPPPDES